MHRLSRLLALFACCSIAPNFVYTTAYAQQDEVLVGNPDLCFAIADGYFRLDGGAVRDGNAEDTLGFLNLVTGNTNSVTGEPPNTGTNFIEAMSFRPGGTTLYATDSDTLGTINLLTGVFTAIGDAGDTNSFVTDIDGLSFDPTTGKLWGTERNSGTTADQLLELDPDTGAILTGPTNVQIQRGLGDLDDLAIDPVWGTFYAIQNQSGGPDYLTIIDPSNGNTFTVGRYTRQGTGELISDMEGLAFSNDSQLYGTTGKDLPSARNALWRIDKTTAVAELVGEFTSRMSDLEALDCLTAPSFLAIEKSTNGVDADEAPGVLIPIGNNVVWSYFLRNTGGQLITNIVLTDDNGTSGNTADDITVCTIPQLAPGQSNVDVGVTCEVQGTATDGQYTNIATATGLSVGETLTQQDPSNYLGYNPGAIGDYVWIDFNKNGIQEAFEAPLPNVVVKLHNANDDALLGTTTSDSAGFYLFDNLAAGDYYLIFDLTQNTNFTTFTTQNAGGNDAVDSDVNSSGRTPNINLSAGGTDRSWDAGVDGGDATALTITSPAAASVQENQTNAIDVQSTDDLDSEGSGLTYSLTGGADQAFFSIDANTGVVTFNNAPDFEAPGDANADNDYEFQVTVTDSVTLTDVQDVVISVTDEPENTAPMITSGTSASVPENQTSAIDVQSGDNEDSEGLGLTYSKTGGADEGMFNLDANSGVLTFMNAPDFEVPGDANGGNDYEVQVTVTDSGELSDVQDIVINILNELDGTETDLSARKSGSGFVTVNGTSGDDSIVIAGTGPGSLVIRDGANDGAPVGSFDGVGGLSINGKSGTNHISLISVGIPNTLTLNGGGGDDKVTVEESLAVGGGLDINLAGGNNVVMAASNSVVIDVMFNASIDTNNGDDVVDLPNITTGNHLDIDVGGGEDLVMLGFEGGNVYIDNRLTIHSGSGANEIVLVDVQVSEAAQLFSGSGIDDYELIGTTVGGFMDVIAGSGSDDVVSESNNIGGEYNVNCGPGVDSFVSVNDQGSPLKNKQCETVP